MNTDAFHKRFKPFGNLFGSSSVFRQTNHRWNRTLAGRDWNEKVLVFVNDWRMYKDEKEKDFGRKRYIVR